MSVGRRRHGWKRTGIAAALAVGLGFAATAAEAGPVGTGSGQADCAARATAAGTTVRGPCRKTTRTEAPPRPEDRVVSGLTIADTKQKTMPTPTRDDDGRLVYRFQDGSTVAVGGYVQFRAGVQSR